MPFRTALSGINAASSDLRVIGNNVANAGTTGFKKSSVQFANIFAASNLGTSANAIGSGVRVVGIDQQFTQGNVEFTANNLDLAITGQGFFRLNDGGTVVYSRAGAFGVDRNGFVVNAQGQRLTGYLADTVGNVTGALGDIRLDNSDIPPRATTRIGMNVNLDGSATPPVAHAPSSAIALGSGGTSPVLDTDDSPVLVGPMDLVDGFGREVTGAQLQFSHVAGNEWSVSLIGAGGTSSAGTFTVGTDGIVNLTWDPDGAAGAQPSRVLEINVADVTQASGGGNTDVTASVNGAVQGDFDPNDATTYNNSTSLTVYDSLGAAHLATVYFRQTGTPNQWESYVYIGDQLATGGGPDGAAILQFDSEGGLSSLNGTPVPPNAIDLGAVDTGSGAGPVALTLDLSSITQFGEGFNVAGLSQDGFATGRLNGIEIDSSGVVFAQFTNGQSRTLAQVALANFSNPQGLSQLGDNSWAESFDSGPPLVGIPGSSSLGLIESGALEGSNVDLTEQLVRMITTQRNFQANAQVISTADAVTQSILNIR